MAGKKIVVVMGSPRRDGNSSTLAEQVIKGGREAGAIVESFSLQELDVRPCDACAQCQGEDRKEFHIQDGMVQVYPKLREADALVISSPIYYFNMTAQTKAFIDRCYALQTPDGNELAGKHVGIVMTYGDSNPFNSGAVNALRSFQDAFAYIGAEIEGMVYGSASDAGEVSGNQVLMTEAYELGKALAA